MKSQGGIGVGTLRYLGANNTNLDWRQNAFYYLYGRLVHNELSVYFSGKLEAFNVFKSFKGHGENETGRTIKNFRMDCRGEYCSKVYDKFCETRGILR